MSNNSDGECMNKSHLIQDIRKQLIFKVNKTREYWTSHKLDGNIN